MMSLAWSKGPKKDPAGVSYTDYSCPPSDTPASCGGWISSMDAHLEVVLV